MSRFLPEKRGREEEASVFVYASTWQFIYLLGGLPRIWTILRSRWRIRRRCRRRRRASRIGWGSGRSKVLEKVAYLYSCLVLALVVLLLGSSLCLHLAALLGSITLSARFGFALTIASFLIAGSGIGLAKERNVWRNEFMDCPVWLRVFVVALMVYGWCSGFVQIASSRSGLLPPNDGLIATSISLFLVAGPLCILYPVVFRGTMDRSELADRLPISLCALGIVTVMFLAARAGYLPHSHR